MKKQSNNLLSSLSAVEMVNLTSETKEVLATDLKKERSRIMSAADLWHIQRQRRKRMLRRFI